MSLNNEDIEKIASLARLAITDDEKKIFLNDLNNIFGIIEKMESIDLSDIEPLSHPQELSQRLRDDVAVPINVRSYYQKHSPSVENGFFLVPKVIE